MLKAINILTTFFMGVAMHAISSIWSGIQRSLFPFLEEELGPLTPYHTDLAAISDPVLRRMCGWEKRNRVPSEATFSRVFAEFAESRLCERVHEALIKRTLSDQGRNTGS